MKKTCSFVLLCFVCLLIGCQKKTGQSEHIKVVMKKYSFDPAEIHVKSGAKVVIDATTLDVQHGFDIPALGIKEPVQPGRTTTISFDAPAKGVYEVKCGVICGPHHDDMVAKLIVE
jgi:cytochrome c oxidase subunit 2